MRLNIEELARQAGDDWDHTTKDDRAFLDRFAQLVAAAVKEEAAKLCDDESYKGRLHAQAIRAMEVKT